MNWKYVWKNENMERWKCGMYGNMELWPAQNTMHLVNSIACGKIENWKYGKTQIWKSENMEAWKGGKMKVWNVWEYGTMACPKYHAPGKHWMWENQNLKIWKNENMEKWKYGGMKIWKSEHVECTGMRIWTTAYLVALCMLVLRRGVAVVKDIATVLTALKAIPGR